MQIDLKEAHTQFYKRFAELEQIRKKYNKQQLIFKKFMNDYEKRKQSRKS